MHLVYKNPPKVKTVNRDIMPSWADVYAGRLRLCHLARCLPTFEERARAIEELNWAERALASASKRDGFDATRAARLAETARASFQPELMPRVRPVLVETEPPAPTNGRLTMRGSKHRESKFTPAWPTMRTRGGLPFGLVS